MKIKVVTLDENLNEIEKEYDLSTLELATEEEKHMVAEKEGQKIATEIGESHTEEASKKCEKKTITSFDLPDGLSCNIRRGCRVLMRRYRLYAEVCYPADVDGALEEAIRDCFNKGLRAAVISAGVAIFTPAGLAAAIPAALTAFTGSFTDCMGDKLSNAISYKIDVENFRV
ncbi:hypothetical protein FA950_20885 [Bacillus thuringiensis]|uniref:hypothetical protein n=1 Tax=Bacillus thuringiensis TaxID=1428 RepID=UPI0010ABEDC3|nr:hypothetical protein [Bacillus thuringiensis]TKA02528.1 hypothetical protein FA950_20885 [Bacillus thuringiensis]